MQMGVGWDHCEFHEDAFCLVDDTCAPSAEYKWYQPPVRAFPDNVFYGWNEYSVCCDAMVADDWYCDTEDAVMGIRWWGSHKRWTGTSPPPETPEQFHIMIWTDVPASMDEPFSHPGVVIHEAFVMSPTWAFVGWDYDPRTGEYETAFQYDYTFSPDEYFHQQPGGNIYWVSIAACYGGVPPGANPWGWKTVPRNPDSPAPDDAVTMPNPDMICPVPGTTWEEMGGGSPIYWPNPEDSWDMAFELIGRNALQTIKWEQRPDPEWPGLHAHDFGGGVDYQTITLADQFECQGGEIHDLHWYGNYELDASSQEIRGSGVRTFHLSLHVNVPGVPWCLPGGMVWSVDIPFEAAMETDTGQVNNEGSPIYRYSHVLQQPYPQEPGLVYWFDIAAMSVDPTDQPYWRWQEAGRNPAPILCPAAVQLGPIPIPWRSIEWPTIPPTYTDLAFEVTSIFYGELVVKWSQPPQPFVPPDAFYGWNDYSVYGSDLHIDADDWLCQQQTPVSDVHWWGSYIGWGSPEPPLPLLEAFHLGIWTDEPAGIAFSHPREMIWDYLCYDYTWEFAGWDFDPRDPTAPPEACFKFSCILPEGEWFYQGPLDTIYWLSVAANYIPFERKYPFGWKTRPRAPNSPAPDDAVRIFDPTAPVVGATYMAGEPIWWPTQMDSWDLAFALTTPGIHPPVGVCCLPDNTCLITTETDCLAMGGVYAGNGSQCAGPQACCEPDGTCIDTDAVCCVVKHGGYPLGPGTNCQTGADACRLVKWSQPPNVSRTGVDVRLGPDATSTRIIADNFECTSPDLITDVHLWGSWKDDQVGEIMQIHLSIHGNDPPGPGGFDPANLFPQPDLPVLWAKDFFPGEFSMTPFAQVDPGEWWWDPVTGVLIQAGDSQVWQVDIDIDPDEAFLQGGVPGDPVTYWLAVRIEMTNGEFGWKTRHWLYPLNADAVWDMGSELPRIWKELRYPPGHPYHGLERDSIDMAFALTTECPHADPPQREEPTVVPKNRYISFVPTNPGRQTALRVTLTDMPEPFEGYEGCRLWVVDPTVVTESSGSSGSVPPPTFMLAGLDPVPDCRDWGALGQIDVTDDEIVPSALYEVQAIDCECAFDVEANYSAVLPITTSIWGDIVGDCSVRPCTPPDGVVDFVDITAVVDKFKNAPGAARKARADIARDNPDRKIDFVDISRLVDAFRGDPYPFDGPDECPTPYVAAYSNSGCLGAPGRDYEGPCTEPDQFVLTAGPGTLHVMHRNATYNCCPVDIVISVSVEGNVLRLTEREIDQQCYCICCYHVDATVVNLDPGTYTVEFCWYDYETEQEQCHMAGIEIP